MQADAIKPGQNVVIIDDLIATGKVSRNSFCSELALKILDRRICKGCGRISSQARRKDP